MAKVNVAQNSHQSETNLQAMSYTYTIEFEVTKNIEIAVQVLCAFLSVKGVLNFFLIISWTFPSTLWDCNQSCDCPVTNVSQETSHI